MLRQSLVSRNVIVLGKRTSMRLEKEMWDALKDIALYEKCSVSDVCSFIALQKRDELSMTAATRVFIMLYYKKAMTAEGRKSVHGNLRKIAIEANNNFDKHCVSM